MQANGTRVVTPSAEAQVTVADTTSGFGVAQGNRAEATILLPARPGPVEQYAAQEIVEHIEKVSGVRLSIKNETGNETTAPGEQRFISVGLTRAFQRAMEQGAIRARKWPANPRFDALTSTLRNAVKEGPLAQFPANGYLVRTVGDTLFLVGRDDNGNPLQDTVSAGTLFAAYEWIEKQLGVRWVWPGELGTHVPRASRVISGRWDVQSRPPLLSTQMTLTIGRTLFSSIEGGYTPEQRKLVEQNEAAWYRRNRFARAINLNYGGHAFEDYWDRFGATHPEYFNLLPDGKRRPSINSRVIGMSVANPGFQKQVIEDWKKERSAERPWINAVENDTSGLCVCAECIAWDVPDPELEVPWEHRLEYARRAFEANERLWHRYLGSLSDRYARYMLAIQHLARETDPQATVLGYGYLNYRKPPLATKLNSNIVVGIIPEAPAPLSYLWPLNKKASQDFENEWKGWDKSGVSLYLRPNYLLSGHEQPLVFPHQVAKYFQTAYKHGLIATNYDSLTSMWSTQGPNLYVAARLHWRPDWPVEKILDEYYSLFGPAAREVRNYFEFWENHSEKRGEEVVEQLAGPYLPHTRDLVLKWGHFYRVASLIFTPTEFATAERHLTAAKAAARGDEAALRRVAFLEAGLKDAQLVARASAIEMKLEQSGDTDSMSRIVTAIDDHRKEVVKAFPHALNLDVAAFNENKSWDRSIYRAMSQAHGAQKLPVEGWTLRWDPEQRGAQDQWYRQPGNAADWHAIEIAKPWEKQEIGRKWKAEHQTDYDGWAWYRVKFKVDEKRRGQQLSLLFGAVDESATVYVNGREVGVRKFATSNDWRTPFFIEVNDALKFGQENELVVRVEDKSGDGGIWKPVWLIERRAG
jgi:hypothetical protein